MNQLFRKKNINDILHDVASTESGYTNLRRNLQLRDLVALGIAAIIGAGIFSTIGNAAAHGGPATSMLFIFTAIACGFSALCYARFASIIPISGSAYTYAYASFGEMIAWIIGWDLIMEYAVGNIAVAISWSDYFSALMRGLGTDIPAWLTTDFVTATRGFKQAAIEMSQGAPFESLSYSLQEAHKAYSSAPQIGNLRIILDIPAFAIVVLITYLVFVGIKETKIASNIMVLLKIVILLVVIGVGAFYVNPDNWSPFAPNGLGGVLKGVAGVFFAYIGFDAISTTAEECRNPQRDLPRAMIIALIISTTLYVIICLILTGMVHYSELAVGDPLAFVFEKFHLTKLSGIIAISALIAMTSVLLVFQVGQPRIWMSMSRDGLLPKRFSRLHKKYKTPAFATILTGVIVAVPALFLNLTEVTDLTSIGTLFAFVLVSGGVLILDSPQRNAFGNRGFKIPYLNCKVFLIPVIIVLFILLIWFNGAAVLNFFNIHSWTEFTHKIPMFVFLLFSIFITTLAIKRKYSLIPFLGLITNLYLITELGITNWMRFIIWLIIGLLIYFLYSKKHSKLKTDKG